MQKKLAQHIPFMTEAWHLALNGWGRVSPNPMVGAVIVKDGKIIAQGFHQRYGDCHAEVNALKGLTPNDVKGATLYVTLEPCSHWGKQPPCTQAIIQSGIKHVVVGCLDPNPVNNGKSIEILRRAKIKVELGVLAPELNRLNEAFNKYITTRTPWVIAKTAQTIDGKIATLKGESKWITSSASRDLAHQLRFGVDAIMVGINTVLMDNPALNCQPKKRLVKVIIDSRLRISSDSKLFVGAKPEDVLVFCLVKPTVKHRILLSKATVIQAKEKSGRVDLAWVLKYLGQRQVGSVLIEGGGLLVGQALQCQLVDQLMIYVAPVIMGQGKSSFSGLSVKNLSATVKLEGMSWQNVGEDIVITANPVKKRT